MRSTSTGKPVNNYLGLPGTLVRLADYCSEWPLFFQAEKQRIAEPLSPLMPSIEHIGSTAVPGLVAKPVIDILLGIDNTSGMHAAQYILQGLGYEPKGEKGIPGRLFFTFEDPCLFHIHLVETRGILWNGHVLFRDCLLSNPDLVKEYAALKQDLAKKFPSNRESYTLGKAGFIENALEAARILNS